MKRALLLLVGLAACTPPAIDTYRPVIDPVGVSATRYEADLASCQTIGTAAQADYIQRQNADLAANLIAGALVGAALGNAYGGDYAAEAAAWGAASGVAATDMATASEGPQRIVDRCLAGRGYRVLSDMGRG
jgi:hypothetical protein